MGSKFRERPNENKLRESRSAPMIGIALLVLAFTVSSWSQTTVGTGSITGTITDPTGAVVSGAKIVITNTGTNQSLNLTANASGAYTSGPLDPGAYRLQ